MDVVASYGTSGARPGAVIRTLRLCCHGAPDEIDKSLAAAPGPGVESEYELIEIRQRVAVRFVLVRLIEPALEFCQNHVDSWKLIFRPLVSLARDAFVYVPETSQMTYRK